jgi:hypothetical protein
MAYDLLSKKRTARDWSCGDDGTNKSTGQKIAPVLTIGALALGAWVIYTQPPARQLQEAHFRQWKRHP